MLLQKLPRDGDVYLLDFPNITMALGAGIFVFLLPRDMYLLDVPSFSANLGAGLYFLVCSFFFNLNLLRDRICFRSIFPTSF